MMRILDSQAADFSVTLSTLQSLPGDADDSVSGSVRTIVSAIRQEGDTALVRYTCEFDRLKVASPEALEIPLSACNKALASLDKALRESLEIAKSRITDYHRSQLQMLKTPLNLPDGAGGYMGYRHSPLSRVALYVPGGKAAYPSSVLMNALPAKVAGVAEMVVLTPTPDGVQNPTVLAACALVGVDRVFAVGGAQAVASVAYGTNTIPRCDKIVGPGNAFVAEAKRQVFGAIGIDMVAGPSEVVVISDGSGHPDSIAADLLAQAEHDEWAQSILLCTDPVFVGKVKTAMEKFLPTLPRQAIIEKSLSSRGALIVVPNLIEAVNIANRIAPEHLMLAVENPDSLLPQVKNAGGIFCGHYSCEVLGDYCAGTNHVLPTFGCARFASPLSVFDFLKGTAILHLSDRVAQSIAPHAERMANSEGLQAHALAAKLRSAY